MRRANISSASRKDGESLFWELRRLADVAVFNVAKSCVILAHHLKKDTIREQILKEALKRLEHHEVACPGKEQLARCETLRSADDKRKRKATAAGKPIGRHRGTAVEREIRHEQQAGFCVYFERAPLARYFKSVFAEQNERLPTFHGQRIEDSLQDEPVKLTKETFNCLQVVLEQLLITLM